MENPDNAGTDNGSFYYPLDMSNVVAQYHLNEPSNPLLDTSGNSNNMVLQTGSGFNQSGKFNGALTFDGIDDYATATRTATNTITTQDFSFSFWYYIDEAPSTDGVIFHAGGFGEPGFGVRITSGNQLQITIEDSVTLYSLYRTFNDDTFFNKWVHVTATFDRDGCLYAYFDGIPRGGCKDISSVFRTLDNGFDYNFGRVRSGTWFYNGSLDEFAVFKGEILTPENDSDVHWVTFDHTYFGNFTFENETGEQYQPGRANTNEGIEITIPANASQEFLLEAIMPNPLTPFKYNISINYLDVEYKLDPYFNTTNTSFNNGVYNNTVLNESGYVQLIPQNSTVNLSSGTYTSEIFYSEPYSVWNTLEWVQSVNYGGEYL